MVAHYERTLLIWMALSVASGAAFAQNQADRVLLAPRSSIESSCRQLAAKGVQCKFIPASNIDSAPPGTLQWVPVDGIDVGPSIVLPPERRSWYNKTGVTNVYSQALIYTRTDPAGQHYSMARVVQIMHVGSFDPTPVAGKEDLIWETLGSEIPTAPAGSDASNAYLADLDQRAAAEASSRAAAAAATAAQAKQEAEKRAYEQSPAYKRKQLLDAAVECRKTIAYARAAIAHDERVAAVSGYENRLVREQAAEMIIDCQDTIGKSQLADLQK